MRAGEAACRQHLSESASFRSRLTDDDCRLKWTLMASLSPLLSEGSRAPPTPGGNRVQNVSVTGSGNLWDPLELRDTNSVV